MLFTMWDASIVVIKCAPSECRAQKRRYMCFSRTNVLHPIGYTLLLYVNPTSYPSVCEITILICWCSCPLTKKSGPDRGWKVARGCRPIRKKVTFAAGHGHSFTSLRLIRRYYMASCLDKLSLLMQHVFG